MQTPTPQLQEPCTACIVYAAIHRPNLQDENCRANDDVDMEYSYRYACDFQNKMMKSDPANECERVFATDSIKKQVPPIRPPRCILGLQCDPGTGTCIGPPMPKPTQTPTSSPTQAPAPTSPPTQASAPTPLITQAPTPTLTPTPSTISEGGTCGQLSGAPFCHRFSEGVYCVQCCNAEGTSGMTSPYTT
jgi:hypothetical protein